MIRTETTIPAWAIWRRAAPLIVAAALVVVALAALALRQDERHRRAILRQQGLHAVSLQRAFLVQELRGFHSDLSLLASHPMLQRMAAGEADARAGVGRIFERFARSKPLYHQLRFLDAAGHEMVRVDRVGSAVQPVPEEGLQSKADRYYFREAIGLAPGEVFVSPLDLNVERGAIEMPPRPVVRLAKPVPDESGAIQGLVVLNAEGARLLRELRAVARGAAGDVMLVNLDGEYLQAPDPIREWGWLLGHAESFRSDYPAVWGRLGDAPALQIEHGGALFTIERVPLASQSASSASDILVVSRISRSRMLSASGGIAGGLLVAGLIAAIVTGAFYWARGSLARALHERRIEASESRLRELSKRLLGAQEEERRSLSRVLHDEFGQRVTAIVLDLKDVLRHTRDQDAARAVRRALKESDAMLAGLHDLATRVRPTVLDDLGFECALESLVEDCMERTGIEVELVVPAQPPPLSRTLAENVYRIVQEALANVVQHARTGTARVALRFDEQDLHLTIEDRGCGFEPASLQVSPRLGLLGMRERVELLDGTFSLQSAPGAGTRIQARLPLDGASESGAPVEIRNVPEADAAR